MSSRAIRKLRGDAALIPTMATGDGSSSGEDESDSDNDRVGVGAKSKSTKQTGRVGFSAILDDDDEEASSSSSSSEDNDDSREKNDSTTPQLSAEKDKNEPSAKKDQDDKEEEDLDAILNEFQVKDTERDVASSSTGKNAGESSTSTSKAIKNRSKYFAIILQGLERNALDYEHSMRASLFGNEAENTDTTASRGGGRGGGGSGRGRQHQFLFGPARDGWTRPPHYVGGGLGMTTYDLEPRPLPWPYCDDSTLQEKHHGWSMTKDCWHTFKYSDSYEKDCNDYRQIQQSGDINALIIFVAHHPYVTEALLQLSSVLYQTNHSQEGLALLRRCLYVFECAALLGFTRDLDEGTTFVDADQPENQSFFKALFSLAQVSNIAGLSKTSFSVSKFLLSLDPLRDPYGVLLNLDNFALASNSKSIDQWIVNVVDSDRIQIWYRDNEDERKVYTSDLLEMPNWMYSYALAQFRLSLENPENDDETNIKAKADDALQKAMSKYPSVIGMLLQGNDIDTIARSFQRDWMPVLDYATSRNHKVQHDWLNTNSIDPIEMSATIQSVELIIRIFVMQSTRHWAEDRTLQWLYENLKELQKNDPVSPGPPNPALMRYSGSNPADYDNKIQQLPAEEMIVDPNLIQHAMVIDPNRRRFLRGMPRGGGAGGGEFDAMMANMQGEGNRGGGWLPTIVPALLGPPTNIVNPDWPLLEVFWRSFLPWNRVEGLPPPRG